MLSMNRHHVRVMGQEGMDRMQRREEGGKIEHLPGESNEGLHWLSRRMGVRVGPV